MFALQDRNDIDTDNRIVSLATDPAHVNWDVARCRDDEVAAAHGTTSLLELFFSDSIPDIRAAKAICQDCTLIEPCLAFATERREPWGVWGGQLFQNGKVLAVKRPRGRPPKDPARQLTA